MKLVLDMEPAANASFSGADLAEILREELFAAGTLSRALLQRRVNARTGGTLIGRLATEIEELATWGDLTEGDDGLLAAAPVRVIDRGEGRGFWLGTAPRRWLARRLPGLQIGEGRPRTVVLTMALESEIQTIGGLLLPLSAWAGLDHVLPSVVWITYQKSRIERAAVVNGALVPAEWSPAFYAPSSGWKSGLPTDDGPTLLRWREYAQPRMGLAAGNRLVGLSGDEARRGLLALHREAGLPLSFVRQDQGDQVELSTEVWLPAAEWRLMVGLSSAVHRSGKAMVATMPSAVAEQMIKALQGAGLREEG